MHGVRNNLKGAWRNRWLRYGLAGLLLVGFFFFGAPPILDWVVNRQTGATHPPISPEGAKLHQTLWVADLHADSLMWNRALEERQSRGLVDIPRLIEGGVALQAFTVVSKTPWWMNISSNSDQGDMFTLLVVAQRWPTRTWSSLLERALYQAERLHAAERASLGSFVVIKSRAELGEHTQRRQANPRLTAGYLGIEGAQVLEGELENLERLFDAGFRMLSPSHFFDTEVGGSAHGERKTGLTPFGGQVVVEMERLGMLVDLAHASPKTIDDVLEVAKKPVVFSHTGVVGSCDNQRNLTDDQLQRTAAQGGLIGIGFFETATCGRDLLAVVRAIRHAVDQVGAAHVALGSDFDGFVRTPIDAAGLPALTDALLAAEFSESDIQLIMGRNVERLLMQTLP
jgi:microsomal dipeptidase-like Zn-dependent dipeptidase